MPVRIKNTLSAARSPYLLQHADNPVAWRMWSDEAFELAASEGKLVLVSIGYSACHWCHVMEKESFSDPQVASLMNENFICIKVDREEHPDVDHLYMEAVQLMTGQGGWPLNCFALPDKRPVYGGTYFPRPDWLRLLEQLSDIYQNQSDKLYEYADKLVAGLQPPSFLAEPKKKEDLKIAIQDALVQAEKSFDKIWGGTNQVPKFPVPVSLDFLLTAGALTRNALVTGHVQTTLQRIAEGGIFDHLQGGFARYSTDRFWKVPHFEKMLYDNSQLLALYSKAGRYFRNESFRSVVYDTFSFLHSELKSVEGSFYSALDADTEGEEGRFYTWSREELKQIAGNEFPILESVYLIGPEDEWESGRYVLMKQHGIKTDSPRLSALNKKLLEQRNRRTRPAVDRKVICSWNALLITGLCEAWFTFGDQIFLDQALETASFFNASGPGLYHCYSEGKGYINAYLEDYAYFGRACLTLNRATANPHWIEKAAKCCSVIMEKFYDQDTGNFLLNDNKELPVPVADLYDSVMPSASGSACEVLIQTGKLVGNLLWVETGLRMASGLEPVFARHPLSFGNWGNILATEAFSLGEVAVTGPGARDMLNELNRNFLPGLTICGSDHPATEISIFKGRFDPAKTQIFLCRNNTCSAPVYNVVELMELLTE